MKGFEHGYGIVREITGAVQAVIKLLPDLEQIFKRTPVHKTAAGDVSDIVLDKMRPHLDLLRGRGMIAYATGSNKIVFGTTGAGNMVELKIEVRDAYYKIAPKFGRQAVTGIVRQLSSFPSHPCIANVSPTRTNWRVSLS